MAKRRFEMRLDPELADRLTRFIAEEHRRDAEQFYSPRPLSQILEMLVSAGLDLVEARMRFRAHSGVAQRLDPKNESPLSMKKFQPQEKAK